MKEIPDGVLAMLVTPLDEKEEIDYGKLRAEVDWCAEQGVAGIVVTPSIGEFACLSNRERWRCFEVCMDQVASKHPHLYTVATVAATTTREAVKHAKHAKDIGYDAAQLIPPYYWLPDESEVYRHYQETARIELPIVIYHNPSLSKFYITRKFMAKLAAIPGIIAIKEVKTDRHVELEPLFRGVRKVNPKVKIYTTFRAFTTGLVLGSNGGFINVFAVPFCLKMWSIFQDGCWIDGSFTNGQEIMEEIQNTLNEIFPRGGEDNHRHIGTTKMFASVVTGIDMGSPRAPYMLPDKKFEEKIRLELSRFYNWWFKIFGHHCIL